MIDKVPAVLSFLSFMLIPSIDCNFKHVWVCHSHLWFGKLVFSSWGEQSLCHPFPYTDVISIGVARIKSELLWNFCPDGDVCRNGVQDVWGWLKRSRAQRGKNPLLTGYRMRSYTIQFFLREVNYILRIKPNQDLTQQILVIPQRVGFWRYSKV